MTRSTALVVAGSRFTWFPGLCGSLACQETAEHCHGDCSECGSVLMPGLANPRCRMCRWVCYSRMSSVYAYLPPEPTLEERIQDMEQRLHRYEQAPGRCGNGHVTLPLVLWNCPECSRQLDKRFRRALTALHRLLQIEHRVRGCPNQDCRICRDTKARHSEARQLLSESGYEEKPS